MRVVCDEVVREHMIDEHARRSRGSHSKLGLRRKGVVQHPSSSAATALLSVLRPQLAACLW